jgi:hypothetical protein
VNLCGELIGSNHQTIFSLNFSQFDRAVEKENKLPIGLKQVFFSVFYLVEKEIIKMFDKKDL